MNKHLGTWGSLIPKSFPGVGVRSFASSQGKIQNLLIQAGSLDRRPFIYYVPCRNGWNVEPNLLGLSSRRRYSCNPTVILGIETSCDDTGAAIVTGEKEVLGEALHSQLQTHLNNGGIIPPIAKHLHEQHISRITDETFQQAKMTLNDIDAIAVTVKPGLSLSLIVGLQKAKEMSWKSKKPIIPIHHMKAHALTCRMIENVEFPFMVLLVSGGHCLLAIAKSIEEYQVLGQTIDDAPGEAFDKTARRLKLGNIKEGSTLSGGAAVEHFAKQGNGTAFQFPTPMYKYRDCNFSFSGLKFIALRHTLREERKFSCEGSDVIPTYADLCASFQHAICMHLCKKIQRGMLYADWRKLIPPDRRLLVVSGGVACNRYIQRGLQVVCEEMNYRLLFPPNKLCTDNGVMIAWNGIEKWNKNSDIISHENLSELDITPKSPIGTSLHDDIRNLNIKCKRIKMSSLIEETEDTIKQQDQ